MALVSDQTRELFEHLAARRLGMSPQEVHADRNGDGYHNRFILTLWCGWSLAFDEALRCYGESDRSVLENAIDRLQQGHPAIATAWPPSLFSPSNLRSKPHDRPRPI